MRYKTLIEILATFFYLGKVPKIPGTAGTLAGIPVVFLLALWSPLIYMLGTIIVIALAIFVSSAHEARLGVHDGQEIVIDEVVGFVVAMTWLPVTWQSFLMAFVLFRTLDILKPFPIGLLDKKVQGGFGVVIDDVAAGLISNMILQIVYAHTTWLGQQ